MVYGDHGCRFTARMPIVNSAPRRARPTEGTLRPHTIKESFNQANQGSDSGKLPQVVAEIATGEKLSQPVRVFKNCNQ